MQVLHHSCPTEAFEQAAVGHQGNGDSEVSAVHFICATIQHGSGLLCLSFDV